MSSDVSLGLNLPYVEGSMEGATPRWADILEMATTAEAIGFEAVWISDHVGFGDPKGEWSGAWESWTLLSALAAATTRVRLGTYVSAAPFRNPALFAKMAETLDEVSGGRDPKTLVRSAETLIETGDGFDPGSASARLRRYADLGISHVQVQLRPNSIVGVKALAGYAELASALLAL